MEKVIFDKSVPDRKGYSLPGLDVPEVPVGELIPGGMLRKEAPRLPELSEVDVVRHFTNLSRDNYGVDQGFYPLGSCTMKYNPKVNEDVARLPGFSSLHPAQPPEQVQGALELLYRLESELREILGMDRVSLQPVAGAHGEMAGMLIIRAFHLANGNPRRKVLVPDSAHGTNPATARLAGYAVEVVRSGKDGLVDTEDLRRHLDTETAGLMLTNPNTLGLFEREILKISEMLHSVGALMYLDGANLNALLGLCRPGDMGFDVVHANLHKTFSTPHGGGGPGAGALGVKSHLSGYVPAPVVEQNEKGFFLNEDLPQSIGRVHPFFGNFGNLVRAYAYIRRLGASGLVEVSSNAIINANYVRKRLEDVYPVPYNQGCMHEFVASAKKFRGQDVHAWDIAKRLLDFDIYSPTVNFPLVVDEALMIEPTETESRENLDRFCEVMLGIAREIETDPETVRTAPHTRSVGRLDEVRAVKSLDLRWTPAARPDK
ncbi:MAG TPA: aminomethyl-transferring glycine dehydrogenase subunit GcvPB [Nitrospiria bacterium]